MKIFMNRNLIESQKFGYAEDENFGALWDEVEMQIYNNLNQNFLFLLNQIIILNSFATNRPLATNQNDLKPLFFVSTC
jgi:hypothetical protein